MKKLFLSLFFIPYSLFLLFSQPVANFTFTPTGAICVGDTVYFTNLSTGYDSSRWDFGDFSPVDTTTHPKHPYGWQGVFNVELRVYNTVSGDSSVIIKPLYVTPVPGPGYAMFTYSPMSPVCLGMEITFTDWNFMFMPPSFVIWDFDDGDSSNLYSPSHTYAAPGTYMVVLIAGNACGSDTDSVSVTVSLTAPPPNPAFGISPNPVCPNTVVVFSNFSFPEPYISTWLFGDGDSAFTRNASHSYSATGTYTVSLTVDNGCNDTTIEQTVLVTNTIVPTVNATASNDTVCPNDAIAFTGSGTNLTGFFWDFGDGNTSLQQNPTHSYSLVGTYTVTFTGTNGCGNSASKTLVIRVMLNATPIADFNAAPFSSCSGFSSICPGTIVYFTNTTINGVSWNWDFGDAFTSTLFNPTHAYAAIGDYTVTLIATSSCGGKDTIQKCVRVVDNVIPSAWFCYNWPMCFPTAVCPNTPILFINMSSDTTSVFWDFGDGNTSTLVNPVHTFTTTGTYIVTLTVTNPCGNFASYTAAVNVTNGNAPSGTMLNYFPLGACPGANISFWGWNMNVTRYDWDFGDGGMDSIQNPIHAYASSGTYTVTLIASNGCGGDTVTEVISISDGSTPDFIFTSTCQGDTVFFTDTSVPVPDAWAWDFGDGDTSTLQNPSHIFASAGTYQVILSVTKNGCVTSITKNVTIINITLSTSTVPATCVSGGSASVIASGGNFPYTYLWNPGGQTTSTATGLSAGTYTVIVQDAIGCADTATAAVASPPAVIASICSVNNASCNGVCDGDADVCVAGGTAPFNYLWSSGQTTSAVTGLCAGTYTTTITDANGCTDTAVIVITEPAVLTVSITPTNTSCNSLCNGTVSASASGGTPGYTYLWSTGCTLVSCTGLCAGTYTLTVTDANNCTATSTVTITQPSALSSGITGTNVSCNGAGDGSADLTVSGGTSPYTFSWNPGGATTEDISGLSPDTYTVTITDANGCTAIDLVTITEPTILVVVVDSAQDVSCNGGNDGFIFTTVNGGTLSYTYLWNPGGQNTDDLMNVTAGVYTLTITDGNGCTTMSSDTIIEPPAIVIAVDSTKNVTVCAGIDGAIYISASGGTGGYTYSWSPGGQTTEDITSIPSGPHVVTVTDVNGCAETATITITDPAAMLINVDSTDNVSCNGGNDGKIYISPVGGTPPLTYTWSSGNTTQDVTGLTAGTYTVVVSDAGGCSVTGVLAVTEPSVLTFSVSATNASCATCCDGTANASPSGGTAPYTYSWMPGGQTTSSVTGLCPDNYTVCITDANGCTTCDSVNVSFAIGVLFAKNNVSVIVYPNPFSESTTLQITNRYEYTNYELKIYDLFGREMEVDFIRNSSSFVIRRSNLPQGIYFYKLTNGKEVIAMGKFVAE